MTGLVAVVAADAERQVDPDEVEALALAYESLRGAGRRDVASSGRRAHAALIGRGDGDPSIFRSGSSWAAAAGTVYGGALPGTPLEELDGQFAIVADDGEQETTVATDPFGLQSLYVARRDGRLYVSTSCLALAEHLRAAPDRFGLEIFLRAGYHFGTRTSWEGIERLDPGTCVTVGPRGASERRYWQPVVDPGLARLEFDKTVEHCIENAAATFRAHLGRRPEAWVDLTGGYDTRMLALLLRASGVPLVANTRGDPEGGDREIAHELAGAAGWELLDLTTRPDWERQLREMLPVALAWGDGNLEVLELSWVLWAHAELARRRHSLLIAGGGEHYRGFAWRQEFLAAGKSTRVRMDNWLDMRLLHPMDTGIFAADTTEAVRSDFDARMRAWAEPYADELNTTQLDVMYAYKMTGHFGAYLSADGAFVAAELPFYFKPVFTAAFSSRHRHRDQHRLMRHMIWHLDRRLAAIPTTTGGPAVPWRPQNLHRFVPYYAQLARRAANKLSHQTFGRALLPTSSPDFYCPAAARRAAISSVVGDGSRAMRSAALFDTSKLDELFARASAARFGDTAVLGRILTVELAFRALDTGLE